MCIRDRFDPELYSTDILTDHAIDFVRDNEEGPFFIYLSYKSVHSGFQPSPSRKGMYKDEKAVYPPSFNVPELSLIHILLPGESRSVTLTAPEDAAEILRHIECMALNPQITIIKP